MEMGRISVVIKTISVSEKLEVSQEHLKLDCNHMQGTREYGMPHVTKLGRYRGTLEKYIATLLSL